MVTLVTEQGSVLQPAAPYDTVPAVGDLVVAERGTEFVSTGPFVVTERRFGHGTHTCELVVR